MAKNSALLNVYLLAYNALSAVGWAFVFYITAVSVLAAREDGKDWSASARAAWDAVNIPLKVVQTMAVMEIVHAAVGFVRSPLGSTLMQGTLVLFVL